FEVLSDVQIDPARVHWNPSVKYDSYCAIDSVATPSKVVCGAVTCQDTGVGLTCSIPDSSGGQIEVRTAIIIQGAEVFYPTFQMLPATATQTTSVSGTVHVDFVVQPFGAGPGRRWLFVQGVNQLFDKIEIVNSGVGVHKDYEVGSNNQIFLSVVTEGEIGPV